MSSTHADEIALSNIMHEASSMINILVATASLMNDILSLRLELATSISLAARNRPDEMPWEPRS